MNVIKIHRYGIYLFLYYLRNMLKKIHSINFIEREITLEKEGLDALVSMMSI